MNAKALLASGMVAAGAALVAAPWLLGQRIEREFRQGIETAGGASLGTPVRISLLSYERGFYSSTARTRVDILPEPAAPNGEDGEHGKPEEPFRLELDHRIVHGLGTSGIHYARVITTLAPESLQGSALGRFFGDAQPLTITTTVGLTGATQGQLHSPAARNRLTADTGEGEIIWQGLQGSFLLPADGQSSEFSLDSAGLQAEGAMGSARLDGLAVRGRMYKGAESGLWLGDTSTEMARAELQMMGSGFAMDGLRILGEAREANGLVSSSVAWQSRRIGFGADEVSDLALRMTISNLDAAALKAYEDSMQQPLTGASPEQIQQQMRAGQEMLARQMPRLLAKKPQLTIEQSGFKFNGAAVNLGGKLRYAGNGKDPFSPADLAGEAHVVLPAPMLAGILRKRLETQAQAQALLSEDGSVDASALAEEASRQMIDGLVQQGLLMAEADGRYRSDFKLEQGAFTINGLPFQGLPSAGAEAEADDQAGDGSEPEAAY